MRAPPVVLAALLLACAGTAAGAPLAFEAELSLDLGGPLPALVVTGTGVATVNGSAGGAHLSSLRLAGGITGAATVPVTDPEVTQVSGLVALELDATLGTGTLGFAGTPLGAPGLTRAALPVRGVLRLCLFSPSCNTALSLPLASSPDAVGVGGLMSAGPGAGVRMSLLASPWTVGTAFVTVTTNAGSSLAVPAAGWVHGALSFTTSTALVGGAFSGVTPLRIQTTTSPDLPGFGRLTVRFVPEPHRLPLLVAGVLGLSCLGRARGRARARRS
jgi:hypothetical protein